MHILFLSDNFPPEVNAPASRTYEHCREWVKLGHEVTVITCAPNFPKGRVFDGYSNRLFARETVDGIKVIRVWTYITANEGFIKRILDYLSFMIMAIPASFAVRKVDIVIGTSPQFFTACAAFVVGVFKRRPWIFELRDIWPESIKVVGAMKDSSVLRFLEKLEMFLYRRATRVVSVTKSFKKVLVDRGIDADKIDVVRNGADVDRFVPVERSAALTERYGLQGKTVVAYVGTHGMAHCLETVIDAAAMLEQEQLTREIVFLFLGDGASKANLKAYAEKIGVKSVRFLDSVPREEVPAFWSVVDYSVVHLKKTPLFETVIPSKIFESIAMGVPLLHGVLGESADIVRKHSVGIVFEPENVESLADNLRYLIASPELREKLVANCLIARGEFCRKSLAGKMSDILEDAAGIQQSVTAAPIQGDAPDRNPVADEALAISPDPRHPNS